MKLKVRVEEVKVYYALIDNNDEVDDADIDDYLDEVVDYAKLLHFYRNDRTIEIIK